ncbi:unnamed protein product [Oikopleura dioica]|uniref:SLC12A transporter C-terminal domain-containing protein n=1 Tax=Oikopleura dioica TaxID=34765 RepID=E4WT21_OIKDI|nr:unnamed protein product [Oikopleura dioica]
MDNNMTWSPTHNSAHIPTHNNRNNAEIIHQLRRVKFDESDYAKTYAKMHNARALNNVILDDSDSASLVIINLPAPPSNNFERERTYMMFIEALTMNLERVLLIRGSGKEVITAYG